MGSSVKDDSLRPRISDRIRKKISECVLTSPVTIVVGPTGCGKSTGVPSALLDDIGGPILCTQPRRLAVFALATRVAEERGVTLGGAEVGYHMGQVNHSLSCTKLLFTTAGILLEELRAQGVNALSKYKVVIIDECHERSPESDLVLALSKTLLKAHPGKNIRIVLMSATFDHGRYRQYFSDVPGCDSIDTITLETASYFEAFYDRVQTFYLDTIIPMLPDSDMHQSLQRAMRLDPDSELRGSDGGKTLSPRMLNLIYSLLLRIHKEEPIHGTVIIFAPTYRLLEQIYDRLVYNNSEHGWTLGVLHSSVDMEHCLRSMKLSSNHNSRKILLASAIADSSVTVPGVTCIIDLCRALQVKWHLETKSHVPKTVWASKSICEQRKGRTGRTCPGRVFRLVPHGFYISRLENWEVPQLTLSSCRDECLKLLSAIHITDPSQLLKRCLDPPSKPVIQAASDHLRAIGACVENKKGRLVPTQYGELMAELPFKVDDSQIIIKGAQLGLLHEILVLRAVISHKPAPIVHHFGDAWRNEDKLLRFYPEVEFNNATSVNIANLVAFMFWDATWNGRRARAAGAHFAYCTGSRPTLDKCLEEYLNDGTDSHKPCCFVWHWTPQLDEKHTKWCEENDINPTSVLATANLVEATWNVLYKANFESEWLRCSNPTPRWRRLFNCSERKLSGSNDLLSSLYGASEGGHLVKALTALCESPADASLHAMRFLGLNKSKSLPLLPCKAQPVACIHFLQGNCIFGSECRNSHSPFAARPMCKYFLKGLCSRGKSCSFSHENSKEPQEKRDPLLAVAPLLPSLILQPDVREWLGEHRHRLLLLGEGNFEFTRSLVNLRLRPSFASDLEEPPVYQIGSTDIYCVDATRIHLNEEIAELVEEGILENFVWNFPFTGIEEVDEIHESLLLGTFLSLNELFDATKCPKQRRFAVTLQGDQFSRWNLMRSAIRTGWSLTRWGAFSAADFPGYYPRRTNGETFSVSSARFYVFEYCPTQNRQ